MISFVIERRGHCTEHYIGNNVMLICANGPENNKNIRVVSNSSINHKEIGVSIIRNCLLLAHHQYFHDQLSIPKFHLVETLLLLLLLRFSSGVPEHGHPGGPPIRLY